MSEQICPVCGERDPYPRWFCMFRAAGVAKPGKPCSYSLDGSERMAAKFATYSLSSNNSGIEK